VNPLLQETASFGRVRLRQKLGIGVFLMNLGDKPFPEGTGLCGIIHAEILTEIAPEGLRHAFPPQVCSSDM